MTTHLTHLSPADHDRIREARCQTCAKDTPRGRQSSGIISVSCATATGEIVLVECPDCDGTGRPEVVWLAAMEPQPPERPSQDSNGKFCWDDGQAHELVARRLPDEYVPHRSGAVLVVGEEWCQCAGCGYRRLWRDRPTDGRCCDGAPLVQQPPETMPPDIPGATRILATADPVARELGTLLDEERAAIGWTLPRWCLTSEDRFVWLCRGRVQD